MGDGKHRQGISVQMRATAKHSHDGIKKISYLSLFQSLVRTDSQHASDGGIVEQKTVIITKGG